MRKRVITDEPIEFLFHFTGGDAFCNINRNRCRIVNYSPGQETKADKIEEFKGKTFGLRKTAIKCDTYEYVAFVIKEVL